jgi:hypothetical protein
VLKPKFLQLVAHQVARHRPAFGDRVGDRRASREDNAPAPFQQPLRLEEQIGCALAFARVGESLDSVQPGRKRQVLSPVRLVNLCGYPHKLTYADSGIMPSGILA